jgi:hypothetical protein
MPLLNSTGTRDKSKQKIGKVSSYLYNKTKNVEAVRRLLGQSSVTAVSRYLGVKDSDATELAKSINI